MAMTVMERGGLRERIESELAELVVGGASRDEITAALEAAMDCQLWVVDGEHETDTDTLSHPIVPGTEVLGRLQSDVPLASATTELAIASSTEPALSASSSYASARPVNAMEP